MTLEQISALTHKIKRMPPTELDRSIPRVPTLRTKILLSDEEKSTIVASLEAYAASLQPKPHDGASDESYDNSYGV